MEKYRIAMIVAPAVAIVFAAMQASGHAIFHSGDFGDFGNGVLIGIPLGIGILSMIRYRRGRAC